LGQVQRNPKTDHHFSPNPSWLDWFPYRATWFISPTHFDLLRSTGPFRFDSFIGRSNLILFTLPFSSVQASLIHFAAGSGQFLSISFGFDKV
jgi:hypothetical protein